MQRRSAGIWDLYEKKKKKNEVVENESNLGPFYWNVIEFENHLILWLPRSVEHFQSEGACRRSQVKMLRLIVP